MPTTRSAQDPDTPTERGRHDARNEVQLAGKVTAAPERRTLPSGDEVVSFGVSVPREGGGTDAIPVQVGPAPGPGGRPGPGQVGRRRLTAAERLEVGVWVAVEGRIRRRWWEAAGARRSRIEVAATSVTPLPS